MLCCEPFIFKMFRMISILHFKSGPCGILRLFVPYDRPLLPTYNATRTEQAALPRLSADRVVQLMDALWQGPTTHICRIRTLSAQPGNRYWGHSEFCGRLHVKLIEITATSGISLIKSLVQRRNKFLVLIRELKNTTQPLSNSPRKYWEEDASSTIITMVVFAASSSIYSRSVAT